MSPSHNSSNYITCLFVPTRWSMLYWRQPPRGGGRKSIKCSTDQANKRGCCMHRTRWFEQNSPHHPHRFSPLSVLCWLLNTQCTLDLLWWLVFSVQCSLAGVPSTLLCTTTTSTLSTSLWMCADFPRSRRLRYVSTGGQGVFACQVQVACPVISACLLNGPSRTGHFACFVVDRPCNPDSLHLWRQIE